MMTLLVVFFASLVGMVFVPVRHLRSVRNSDGEDIEVGDQRNSVMRVYIIGGLEWVERWYKIRARESFLKFIDNLLRLFERMTGRLASQTKNIRLMLQEHFRVIPRESLYWKNIHTWKRGDQKDKQIDESQKGPDSIS